MKRVLTSAGLALGLAAHAAAGQVLAPGQALMIDWLRTTVPGARTLAGGGPEGTAALELRAGGPGSTSFHLVTVIQPPVGGAAYVVSGLVRYDDVEGQGYLEMWTSFPDDRRFFTRTTAAGGTLAALHGASGWRRFELPFDPGGTAPSRLEISLVLPGRGTVWLGPLRLEPQAGAAGTATTAWWDERAGNQFGGLLGGVLGAVGAIIGVLSGAGKARRLVVGLLLGLVVVGAGLALVGAAAALSAQPRHVWYPVLLPGGLAVVVGLAVLPVVRRRFAADELRRMDALDARRP